MTYKEIYKELKRKVRKDYGKQCPVFQYGCPICDQYIMLQILEDAVDIERVEQ